MKVGRIEQLTENKSLVANIKGIDSMSKEVGILSDKYQRLIVETESGEVVAEITKTDAIPATGYQIRLMPEYD